MSSLIALTSILRPPFTSSGIMESDWLPVEAHLGLSLPDDYKTFIDHYGTGAIDSFLYILNPFSSNPRLNLLDEGRIKLDAIRQLRHEVIPYLIHPDAGGLLPWGVTDNGDVLYWLCAGSPSHWSIVVNESRGPRWREYKLSTTGFLAGLVAREIIVDIFPDDFPSDPPSFTPVS